MRRVFKIVIVIVVLLVVFAYGLLFTQPGNNLLKPVVESKINSAVGMKMRIEQFSLRPSYVALKLKTPMNSIFIVKGRFNLFSKSMNLKYLFTVNKNENKLSFKQFELKGPFFVKGTVRGSINGILKIDGKSNFADSNILYKLALKNKKPFSADVNINNLRLKNLLIAMNKPAYADALLKAVIKVDNFEKNTLKGKVSIYATNGVVDRAVIKKVFNMDLPETTFKASSNFALNGSIVDFSSYLYSNLLTMSIDGSQNQQTDQINGKYKLNIAQLALLKPILNLALNGGFATEGTIKGTRNLFDIFGKSNIADSNTTYDIKIANFKIKKINVISRHAKLQRLLAILNKPQYATGFVDARININNINLDKLNGKAEIDILRGSINTGVIKKLFNVDMPVVEFSSYISSTVTNSVAFAKIKLDSSIASLNTRQTVFNIKKFNLNSDYTLRIPDLDKFYFITNMHMKGSTTVTGEIKYTEGNLVATAFSKMLGGKIDIKLSNNIITGRANNISMMKVLEMMRYKKIFDSNGNVDFNYNLNSKKGTVKALFVDGHIVPGRITFILRRLTKFDITKEVYKTTTINSVINNKIIHSNLDMVSRLTHITSHNALIDLNRNFIDAKLKVIIKKSPVYIKLKGNIKHPSIRVNIGSLIKNRVKEEIKNRMKKRIKTKAKTFLRKLF